ncbi:unnamed protein product [Orchesella dallaii]|uniref:Cyclopropane-fatty-acyl-phospholipid synthase n=1 Tax=Orchesella dallaii TaxID=48710 RepID=A0ABP1PSJ1_9HEXA
MNFLVELVYLIIVGAIRVYKSIELGIIKLFSGLFINYIFRRCEKLAVVFHVPQNRNNSISAKEETRILEQSNYSSIIHVKINNMSIYSRALSQGPLAIAEGYIERAWEPMESDDQIVELLSRFVDSKIYQLYYHPINRFLHYLEFQAFNLQTTKRAFQVADKHYDMGNDIFESFLDPWMQYSGGYWARADNLNDSQLHKLELIAKKLDLKPGMRVLDMGCGWGTLCKYLAENYGVECVGMTVSKEGAKYAEKVCKGLNTQFRVQDYRDLNEKFDRIVSIECIEHLGHHNYRTFFEIMNKCLKNDGIFLIQIFGANHIDFPLVDPLMHKYFLPNASFPYYLDVAKSMEGLFIIEDWHNFGLDFAKTANAWRSNFQNNWTGQFSQKYGEKFFRLFNFYFIMAEGLFKSRKMQLWQLVLSKDGLKREYRAAR